MLNKMLLILFIAIIIRYGSRGVRNTVSLVHLAGIGSVVRESSVVYPKTHKALRHCAKQMYARRKRALHREENVAERIEDIDSKEYDLEKEAMRGTGILGIELIDVCKSLALQTRDIYPMVNKPSSKLDALLDKRQKQYDLEKKQVVIIQQVIEKYRKQNFVKSTSGSPVKEETIDVVGIKSEKDTVVKPDIAYVRCYSPLCRTSGDKLSCYSVSCQNLNVESNEQKLVKSVEDIKKEPLCNGNSQDSSAVKSKSDYQSSFLSFVSKHKSSKESEVKKNTEKTIKTEPGVQSTTNLTAAIANLIQGGKIQLNATIVADLEKKIACVGKSWQRTSLSKFTTSGRGSSGKTKKSSLPMCQKFLSRHKKHSLLILEKHILNSLARHVGLTMAVGFNYNCKMSNVNWIYQCPRPFFKTIWRYRTQTIKSLATASLQLRILWSCIRWDDALSKPPNGGTNTITTENEITTKEVVKQRLIGQYNLRSEYLIRTIVIPIGVQQEERKGKQYIVM